MKQDKVLKAYTEIVDIERLKQVCDRKLSNYPSRKPNDNSTWYKMTKTDIINYLGKVELTKDNKLEVDYFRKYDGIGRLTSRGCIQHMQKDIRNYILNETLIDIDQKDAHITILQFLFNKYNINNNFIEKFFKKQK